MNLVRYKNRKIYNPSQGKYTNLPQLLTWVREGQALTVVDHSTKNVITERVLLTALTQEAERGKILLAEIETFIREV